MGDSGRAHGVRGAGRSLLGVVLAGGGTGAMLLAARSIAEDARGVGGQEQLILWVLLSLAAVGALLCLYLALVWALAAAIQLAGPAGRTGRMLLPALKVLAPRLARRVSLGAAVASTATGLVLGPALASEPMPGGAEDRPTVLQTSQLLPDEDPAPTSPAEPGAPLPSLGWGGEPSPAVEPTGDGAPTEDEAPAAEDEGEAAEDAGEAAEQSDASPAPSPAPEASEQDRAEDSPGETTRPADEGAEDVDQPTDAESAAAPTGEQGIDDEETQADGTDSTDGTDGTDDPSDTDDMDDTSDTGDRCTDAPRSVVVRPGDTLWSITDDVLGPGPDDPSLLADSWPLLHEANRDVIGEDPDLLLPGQVLTVPAGLDEGATS